MGTAALDSLPILQMKSSTEEKETHPIFFISLQSSVEEIHRYVFIFIQPLDNKRLEPPAAREDNTTQSSDPTAHGLLLFRHCMHQLHAVVLYFISQRQIMCQCFMCFKGLNDPGLLSLPIIHSFNIHTLIKCVLYCIYLVI